ncbi:transcription antitermination factor NusB [Corynebacterium terpenotabidum]|uniref:Transcription antitermination protein NusB n=1 Tax=Corynebacterium terpenotabidum Y-11 TaxID=1200352 RepID=S4XE55_9CORY|nr:transcription antitermination factor NusB [Corynebacterium terpenotabidum]AGP30839.1 N utilization substance protein B-like protein [Corynebacterium terpenotabidum Y-11]
MTEDKNHHRHGSRFRARRRAVDMLFEAEFRDIDPVEIVEDRRQLSQDPANQVAPVQEYTATIVAGVAAHLDGIDDAIAAHLSSEWTLDRLPAVDRAVLRVSAWELLHNFDDVPDKVAVDEGIGLAKEYGHDKAPGYVHAVLDGISRDRRLAAKEAADAVTLAEAGAAGAGDAVDASATDALIDSVVGHDTPDEGSDQPSDGPSDGSVA